MSSPGDRVSVLIVDDQSRFRAAARTMLAGAAALFEVVGEAASGEEGVRLAGVLRPHLVVMDVMLPGIDGAEASRRIIARHPDTVVVLASARKQVELGLSLEGTGAAAFFQKEQLTPAALAELL
jgi:two-component system, NarL family, invasion response regulator UvrY